MPISDSQALEQYEAHYETLLRRVAYRRSLTREMGWLFHEDNTLALVPDYLEFHTVGRSGIERRFNQSLFSISRNLWRRVFWPQIRKGLLSYIRGTYFPIFFQKSSQTPRIEAFQKTALAAVESFLDRQWDDLGLGTFYEVGVLVNEVLKSCYAMLDCPEDVFARDKQQQNQAAFGLLEKYASALAAHPRPLEILVYASCQSNWIDSLEGETSQLLHTVEEQFERMMSGPGELEALARDNPYYQIQRLKQLLSGGPKNILFECDNCGELVFDLLLIQYLLDQGHGVVLGAKARPALNDATVRDVEALLEEPLFAVLQTARDKGRLSLLPIDSVMGGKLLYEAPDDYKRAYGEADFLVLKGQGNFQTMPMGIRRGGGFIPYRYKKPLAFLMPLKSMMSTLCLNSILSPPPADRSLFLYCYDPSDETTYP